MTAYSTRAKMIPGTQAEVEVVRDLERWDEMHQEWSELFRMSPTASPPLRFQWLRLWWKVYGKIYGDEGRGLRIVTVRKEGQLIGALPLYEKRVGGRLAGIGQVGFISTGEAEFEETCADYLDLLHAPGEEELCLEAMRAAMTNGQMGSWDRLELNDIGVHSPLLRWKDRWAGKDRVEVVQRGVCPVADISGGLEAYFGRLSANTRQQCRRLLRAAEKLDVKFEVARGEEDGERFFEDLIHLHQKRWTAEEKAGCFAAPRFTQFHKLLVSLWVPAGKAVISRLLLEEKPVAVMYGFVVGNKYDFYQSGISMDESSPLNSPGIVSFLLLMGYLAECGICTFDFLRGASTYKQRLATDQRAMVQLRIGRRNWRTDVQGIADVLRRAGRKLRKG